MSMRRARWVAAAGVAINLGLSACGGGGSSTAPPSTTLAPALPDEPMDSSTTPEPTPPAEPSAMNTTEITGPLQGDALVQALRKGGLLLWIRHTEQNNQFGTVTAQQVASHDCAEQNALTGVGRQHAKQIGAAIRALHLPIAAVHTARLCLTQTTGRLLHLASVTDDNRLDASSTWVDRGGVEAQRLATLHVLSEAPPAGTDLVLVSSALDIPEPAVLHDLGPGETVVFRPGPAGNVTVLAQIGEAAWPTLLQAVTTTVPPPPTR